MKFCTILEKEESISFEELKSYDTFLDLPNS